MGRPSNISPMGKVWYHPGVVIDRDYEQHITREGKPVVYKDGSRVMVSRVRGHNV